MTSAPWYVYYNMDNVLLQLKQKKDTKKKKKSVE